MKKQKMYAGTVRNKYMTITVQEVVLNVEEKSIIDVPVQANKMKRSTRMDPYHSHAPYAVHLNYGTCLMMTLTKTMNKNRNLR